MNLNCTDFILISLNTKVSVEAFSFCSSCIQNCLSVKKLKRVLLISLTGVLMLSFQVAHGQDLLKTPTKYLNPTIDTDYSPTDKLSGLSWHVVTYERNVEVFKSNKLKKVTSLFGELFSPLGVLDESETGLKVAILTEVLGETRYIELGWIDKKNLILWPNQVLTNEYGVPIRVIKKKASIEEDYDIYSLVKWNKESNRYLVAKSDYVSTSIDNADNFLQLDVGESWILESRIGYVPRVDGDTKEDREEVIGSIQLDSRWYPQLHELKSLLVSKTELQHLIGFMDLLVSSNTSTEFVEKWLIEAQTHNIRQYSIPDVLIKIAGIALYEHALYSGQLKTLGQLSQKDFLEIKLVVRGFLRKLESMKLTSYPYRQGYYYWIPLEDFPSLFFLEDDSKVFDNRESLCIVYANPYVEFSAEMKNACSETLDSLLKASRETIIHGLISQSLEKVFISQISSTSGKDVYMKEISRIPEFYSDPSAGVQFADKKDIREYFYSSDFDVTVDRLVVFLFVNSEFIDKYHEKRTSERWILPEIFQELHYLWESKDTDVFVVADTSKLNLDLSKNDDELTNLRFHIRYLR